MYSGSVDKSSSVSSQFNICTISSGLLVVSYLKRKWKYELPNEEESVFDKFLALRNDSWHTSLLLHMSDFNNFFAHQFWSTSIPSRTFYSNQIMCLDNEVASWLCLVNHQWPELSHSFLLFTSRLHHRYYCLEPARQKHTLDRSSFELVLSASLEQSHLQVAHWDDCSPATVSFLSPKN